MDVPPKALDEIRQEIITCPTCNRRVVATSFSWHLWRQHRIHKSTPPGGWK